MSVAELALVEAVVMLVGGGVAGRVGGAASDAEGWLDTGEKMSKG